MDSNKPIVFMVLPFREEILHLYEELKKKFEGSYEFTNAGDLDNQQNILKDIVTGIGNADIIIADLTGLNPNVFYELGLAHAMNKKVIIITQDIDELPFDIKSYRAVGYSLLFYKMPDLLAELDKLLSGAINGSVKYGNPVSDFLPDFFNSSNKTIQADTRTQLEHPTTEKTAEAVDADTGDKGFLDYIADINENAATISSELESMTDEMAEMNAAVNLATNEINRVKAHGGNLDASFARGVCRKLATPIEDFSLKLQSHVTNIASCWTMVEDSYLSLFDNQYVLNTSNKPDLLESLRSVEDLKSTIFESDGQIRMFSNCLQGSLGIERKLNKATTSLISELNGYLTTTSTIASSIDRIISKGNIAITSISEV